MRKVNVAEDIIPIGEFKTRASEYLRRLHANRRPLVITQNGKAAAVVLTPQEFADLEYRELVKAKIQAGLDRAASGRSLPAAEVRKRLKARIGAAKHED